MKYLKLFENTTNKPEVGDYVSINSRYEDYKDFFLNYPGKIIKFYSIGNNIHSVEVSYGKNIPDNMKELLGYIEKYGYFKNFQYNEIYAFSKTKEDLKLKIAANKFNL